MSSVALVIVMVVGAFAAFAAPALAMTPSDPAIADVERMDVGPQIRDLQPNKAEVSSSASGLTLSYGSADYYDVGEIESYYVDGYGLENWIELEKRGEGALCEVWVAQDLSFPAGDPRNDDPNKITIYDWQVTYIIEQFETVMYPILSDYFTVPAFHDGSNSMFEQWGYPYYEDDSGRLMIMIWNMVDESYFDRTYP